MRDEEGSQLGLSRSEGPLGVLFIDYKVRVTTTYLLVTRVRLWRTLACQVVFHEYDFSVFYFMNTTFPCFMINTAANNLQNAARISLYLSFSAKYLFENRKC